MELLTWTTLAANSQHKQSTPTTPLTIAEKRNLLFLKRTDFSSCRACRNCYHVFLFCSTLYFNLEKLSFRCDQQYRKSNFSDVFCLNCNFVTDATVKHLTSRSFLKCGVSAETMAAHIHFFIKLNQIFIILVSLHSL